MDLVKEKSDLRDRGVAVYEYGSVCLIAIAVHVENTKLWWMEMFRLSQSKRLHEVLLYC